jgi:hypothetical protein
LPGVDGRNRLATLEDFFEVASFLGAGLRFANHLSHNKKPASFPARLFEAEGRPTTDAKKAFEGVCLLTGVQL